MQKNHTNYIIFIGLFFLTNILNTYFLTTLTLNRYISPFPHTLLGTLNAILGNFSTLLLIFLIAILLFKSLKARMKFMLYFTLFLNLMVFASSVFNMYYGNSFTMNTIVMFKNPADGFAFGVILEIALELILYYRIVLFLPFLILLVLFIKADRKTLKTIRPKLHLKYYLCYLFASILMLFTAFSSYMNQYENTLPITATQSTFAQQNLGVYPYYFTDFFYIHPKIKANDVLNIKTDQELAAAYQVYNKNQSTYINFFDGNTYSNRLTYEQAVSSLVVDPSLSTGNELHGILKDRNLVLVHIESLSYFLFENAYTNDRLRFFNDLLNESFVFRNYYSTVGMGVSSDAELAVLTGLYPSGHRTLYWEYNHMNYALDSIVHQFNDLGYYTQAIHGDKETFYNRNVVYPNLFEFDDFYALEDFIADGYQVELGYTYDHDNNLTHISPWISDYHLADEIFILGSKYIENQTPFMMFPVMMMPHLPYDFDPFGSRSGIYPEYIEGQISRLTQKYINYVDYYDDIMKRMFIGEYGEDQTLDQTVYIFYSDHGSGLKNGDIGTLYNRNLSVMELRKILQQTLAFIYVPGDMMVDYGDYSIRKGLLTGEQHLVRSNVDLYRTIVELFDLPISNHSYFGVHGLSVEPTFVMDSRLMDIVLDDYFYSMRNPKMTYPEHVYVPKEVRDYIIRFKLLTDYLVSRGDMQQKINEAIRIFGGTS